MAIDQETGIVDDTKKISVPSYLKISKVISFLLYAWIMFGVIMLLLRTFLLLTSASTSSGFVRWVYEVSADFLYPFRGIFPTKEVSDTGYLDTSAIFAIIIYLIIAWIVSAVLKSVQSKMDDIREQEAERAQRNKIRIIKEQEDAERGNIVEQTTTVKSAPNAGSQTTSTTTKRKTTRPRV